MKITDVIKKPRFTEKAYNAMTSNKYIFDVDINADKDDIRMAVEDLFEVNVVSVRTINNRGKKKARGIYKRQYIKTGTFKKAIVEIAEGQSIKIFDEIFKSEDK